MFSWSAPDSAAPRSAVRYGFVLPTASFCTVLFNYDKGIGRRSTRTPMALKLCGFSGTGKKVPFGMVFTIWRSGPRVPSGVPAVAMGKTLFRHLPKRMFTSYRWGPGEGGVRGERRGMAGTPRTRAVSIFVGTTSPHRCCCNDSGPPSSPPAPRGPLSEPRESGALFSWRRHPASLC